MSDDLQIDISLCKVAVWHFEQAVTWMCESKKLAIQSQGFADLAEEYHRLVGTDSDSALFGHPSKTTIDNSL